MQPYKLALHSLHGGVDQDFKPFRVPRMLNAGSVADRLKLLKMHAESVAGTVTSDEFCSAEVHIDGRNLHVIGSSGERVCSLPLHLSQVSESHCAVSLSTKAPETIGVIAYAHPFHPPCCPVEETCIVSDNAASFWLADVWFIVVTRRSVPRSENDPIPQSFLVLEEAVSTMGRRGSIRCDFANWETLNDSLGEGRFGVVRQMCRKHPSNHSSLTLEGLANVDVVAAKCLAKDVDDSLIFDEITYLLVVQGHPNIITFFGASCKRQDAEPAHWTIVMEFHGRGDLHTLLVHEGKCCEQIALDLNENILSALVYIHGMGITHRDVKAENVLLSDDGRAVLVDFGVATHVAEALKIINICGTPGYMAPEVLLKNVYGLNADVFSCGVVLYNMLSAMMPFVGSNLKLLCRRNVHAQLSFPSSAFNGVSRFSLDLVCAMCTANPAIRPDSERALDATTIARARCVENHRSAMVD